MAKTGYKCPKCGNNRCSVDKMSATGGFLSKIFDVQTKKFTTVTCTECKYTELYKGDASSLGNVLDFFTN